MDYYLANGRELAKAYPFTFYKPSKELCARLKPGDVVKLQFEIDPEKVIHLPFDRMWVRITEVLGDGFVGELCSTPTMFDSLQEGDQIRFGEEHIIGTKLNDPEARRWEWFSRKNCYVTESIFRGEKPALSVLRHPPVKKFDAGLLVYDQPHIDDGLEIDSRFTEVVIALILNLDASFLPLLDTEVGSKFSRNSADDEWVRVV